MSRQILSVIQVLAVLACVAPVAQAQSVTGVFSSPWYLPATPLVSAYDHLLCRPGCVSQSVAAWTLEFADMAAAGIQFLAPYSFGIGQQWADPANFVPNMVTALQQSGSPVKLAHFQDTNGVPIRASQGCGFDLAGPVTDTERYVYTDDIKAFFDRVPAAQRFTVGGRPLIFFYKSYPLYKNRENLGLLLVKIREWFRRDFQGVEPIIVVERDWDDSIGGTPNSCDPEHPPSSPMSQTAIDLVRQNADAFYSWEFIGTVGQKGVISVMPKGSGFPGGGIVTTHPLNGITVGSAGVGYDRTTADGRAARDRRNGLTLTEDWNAIRNTSLRMVMAWWDYDEASGISRDNQTGDKYIKLLNQLVTPQTPNLSSFATQAGPIRTAVGGTIEAQGAYFLPGAVAEFAPVSAPTQVTTLAMSYVSPTLLQFPYGGGAPAGSYYVRIKNSDNTSTATMTISIVP